MPTDLALPSLLGRYRLLRKLGAGGMGTVYLAEDSQLHRNVAVKVPHFKANDDPQVAERFLREARVAASIEHSHLCQVHDVGQANGMHFLVMPFIDGQPLSHMIAPDQPWPPGNAVALVRKLAYALQVLHAHGIVHRDLKPANVMMRANGEPVIMDFGLARSYTADTRNLTETGMPIGTPAYMAPEQMQADARAIGPATDVHALGALLYELLTGSPPFEGPFAAICAQVLTVAPDPPSARRPQLAPWLDDICKRALAKKPSDRFASMAEFAGALAPPTISVSRAVPASRPDPKPTGTLPVARISSEQPRRRALRHERTAETRQGIAPTLDTVQVPIPPRRMGNPPPPRKATLRLGLLVGALVLLVAGLATAVIVVLNNSGDGDDEGSKVSSKEKTNARENGPSPETQSGPSTDKADREKLEREIKRLQEQAEADRIAREAAIARAAKIEAERKAQEFSDAEFALFKEQLARDADAIGRAVLEGTHYSGKYGTTSPPRVTLSNDRRTIVAEFTVDWRGGVINTPYQTVYAATVSKKDGMTSLTVLSDSCKLTKIDPSYLKATENSLKGTLRPPR